jgi:hypothetical protein
VHCSRQAILTRALVITVARSQDQTDTAGTQLGDQALATYAPPPCALPAVHAHKIMDGTPYHSIARCAPQTQFTWVQAAGMHHGAQWAP